MRNYAGKDGEKKGAYEAKGRERDDGVLGRMRSTARQRGQRHDRCTQKKKTIVNRAREKREKRGRERKRRGREKREKRGRERKTEKERERRTETEEKGEREERENRA